MHTDTTRPNHLAQEVIDNSVDEAIAGLLDPRNPVGAVHVEIAFINDRLKIGNALGKRKR